MCYLKKNALFLEIRATFIKHRAECRRLRDGVRGRRTGHGHVQLGQIRVPERADGLLRAAVHAGGRAAIARVPVRRHDLLPGSAVRARPRARLR